MCENKKVNLEPFLESHSELYNIIWKVYRMEEILDEEKFRYLFLASLISTETIVDKESAKKSLEELTFIKKWLPYMNFDKKLKNEIKSFIIKGIKIAKQELNNYKNKGAN